MSSTPTPNPGECSHEGLIAGLDHSYCPDCGKSFRQLSLPLSSSPPTTEAPGASLLTESLPLFAENQEPPAQSSISSVSNELSMLTENFPHDSTKESDGLNQGIYECLSHGKRYYRYICSVGHDIAISRHIPGGCTSNPLAQARAVEVQRWIYLGLDPKEIDRRIQAWSNRRRPQAPPPPPPD